MRTFLSLLAVFALACASAQADPFVVNDIVDMLLKRLSFNEHITSLPDLEEDAEVKVLFWNTSVKIEADDGAPVGGVALKRFGDATLEMSPYKDLRLTVEVGFDEAEIGYEYKTHVASVKAPGGRFTATIGATSVSGLISFYINEGQCTVMSMGIDIAKQGEIKVEDGGTNVVNAVYRKLLVDMVTKKRDSLLKKFVEKLNLSLFYDCNKILPSIFAPMMSTK